MSSTRIQTMLGRLTDSAARREPPAVRTATMASNNRGAHMGDLPCRSLVARVPAPTLPSPRESSGARICLMASSRQDGGDPIAYQRPVVKEPRQTCGRQELQYPTTAYGARSSEFLTS